MWIVVFTLIVLLLVVVAAGVSLYIMFSLDPRYGGGDVDEKPL